MKTGPFFHLWFKIGLLFKIETSYKTTIVLYSETKMIKIHQNEIHQKEHKNVELKQPIVWVGLRTDELEGSAQGGCDFRLVD